MKLAMPVSPIPTFPRLRGKGQTNRCANFTFMLTQVFSEQVLCGKLPIHMYRVETRHWLRIVRLGMGEGF